MSEDILTPYILSSDKVVYPPIGTKTQNKSKVFI